MWTRLPGFKQTCARRQTAGDKLRLKRVLTEEGVMRVRRGVVLTAMAAVAVTVMGAGPALATDCTNASKPTQAGIQLIIGPDGNIEWTTSGLAIRIEHGLIDTSSGAGFHGLIGFDVDGNGTADVSTYVVGPNAALPEVAQINGAACHGIVPIESLLPGGACFSG